MGENQEIVCKSPENKTIPQFVEVPGLAESMPARRTARPAWMHMQPARRSVPGTRNENGMSMSCAYMPATRTTWRVDQEEWRIVAGTGNETAGSSGGVRRIVAGMGNETAQSINRVNARSVQPAQRMSWLQQHWRSGRKEQGSVAGTGNESARAEYGDTWPMSGA
ncbi:hypothetical protein C8R44DRAFT_752241 [Mycena epipterygia]|nr:hypothetical protein C8R44DRAFT_752241 [Mycena epipterygia]